MDLSFSKVDYLKKSHLREETINRLHSYFFYKNNFIL